MIHSQVIGTGHFLPKKILTNAELSKIVETNNEWILSRTGIKQRHIADKNELTSDLGRIHEAFTAQWRSVYTRLEEDPPKYEHFKKRIWEIHWRRPNGQSDAER